MSDRAPQAASANPRPAVQELGLDDLVEELSDTTLVLETRRNRQWNVDAYARWCQSYGRPAIPSSERQIVAYLHSAGAAWSAAHRRHVALSIGWAHEQAGHPDPRGSYLRDYLRAHRRQHGSRRQEAVHALSPEDIASMVRAAGQLTETEVLDRARAAVLRAAVRAGFDLQWTSRARRWLLLLEVRREQIVVHDGQISITADGPECWSSLGPLAVTAIEDPLGHQALLDVLDRLVEGEADRPLQLQSSADATRFVGVLRRARLNWDGVRAMPGPDEIAAWDDERWWWQQRLIQRGAGRALRDTAWLLLAWTNGARFADAHDATVVRRTPDDRWHLRTVVHKTDRTGTEPLELFVEHLPEHGDLCPACALADHVDFQAQHHQQGAPVFATNYRGSRRMTSANARMQLSNLWAAAGGDRDGRVTTRSLRSGAAVTASERGAQLEQVRALLRQHDPRATRHYLRRRRPELVEVHITY